MAAKSHIVPRDFLGLATDTSTSSDAVESHVDGKKLLGPFCVQVPEGDISLARLKQMSEQTGFQLASAFSANRCHAFQGAAKCANPVMSARSTQLKPGQGFFNARGGYKSVTHNYPSEERITTNSGFLKPLGQQQQQHQAQLVEEQKSKFLSQLSDADVQQLARAKFVKDNRGMRWPSWESVQRMRLLQNQRQGESLAKPTHLQAVNIWNAAHHVPAKTLEAPDQSQPQPAAATFLSLGQPGRQDVDLYKAGVDRKSKRSAPPSSAQLTIFYAGNVNVFDNVPSDRARAVMLMAANLAPTEPENTLKSLMLSTAKAPAAEPAAAAAATASATSSQQPLQSQPASAMQLLAAVSPSALPQARKASLARFLERRKERCHMKASASGADSSPSRKDTDAIEVSDQASSQPAPAQEDKEQLKSQQQ